MLDWLRNKIWGKTTKVIFAPPHTRKKRFGKRPARRYSVQFRLGDYIQEVVAVPRVFGFIYPTISWGVLGNLDCGNCVVAGAAHETMLWAQAANKAYVGFNDEVIIKEYQEASGWNGIIDDPSDAGLDMQEFASHRRKRGIPDFMGTRHKVKAYAAIAGINELIQATYIFGAVGVGLMIPASAVDQFDKQEPWTIVPGSPIVGGHYVPCVGRNSRGNLLFVTWGRLHAATPEFVARYMDEAIAYIGEDYLTGTGLSPRLVNQEKLEADLSALSKEH